ncbi:MAG: DoxX family protein [Verrucomicrobia bacterium]|nr:DoxX family protein [Verrucomicrobiota bacterium]
MSVLRRILRGVLAVGFIVAGANHFRAPEVYLGMMPAWLPWPGAMNAVAGAAEMLGGLGLMFSGTRRLAGWGLIALLIAVFPANVHVALEGHMPGFDFKPLTLWLRLPFQALFIGWVWWVAVKRERTPRKIKTG